MKVAPLGLALALVTACATPAPPPPVVPPPPLPLGLYPEPPVQGNGLVFTVEPRTVGPGAMVTLVLRNARFTQLGYNLCSSGLEQRTGSGWQSVATDGVCTRELRILPPRQVARYEKRLPATLESGQYRYWTGVEAAPHTPALGRIYSEIFFVRR
jgi:hypothetical protein